MKIPTKRIPLYSLALGLLCAVPTFATPTGTLNVDSCIGGGVTVTATTIDFAIQCISAGSGTNLTSSFGTITVGDTGTIADVTGPPPVDQFMTFNPGGGVLNFILTSIGPGVGNTTCTNNFVACSIVAGSPFIVQGTSSSTVILPVGGTVSDATGTSQWIGQFSANFAGTSPSDLQAQFLSQGSLSSTTFAGSIVATIIPEPQTFAMIGTGLLLIGARFVRRRRLS